MLVKVAGKDVLFYNTAFMLPPDTLPSFYARSGFIHPLFSPSGKILTDDFPVGHAHQHGIMTAWVNAEFRRKPIDFWNQQLQTGSAKHVLVEAIETGAVTTTIKLRLKQYSLLYGTILSDVKKKQLSPAMSHSYATIALLCCVSPQFNCAIINGYIQPKYCLNEEL